MLIARIGGTKGIGRAIVKSFLDEGAIVHFCSRTEADVKATNERLASSYSGKAFGSSVDVSNAQSVDNWVKSCASQSGQIDVVVANVSALAIDDKTESWHRAFQTDMLGTQVLANATLPYLEKTKGNIISISSVSGRQIDFSAAPSPYGPMKAALIHYMSQVAHKYAPQGVRANSVSPGNIFIEDGVWGDIERNMPDLFKQEHAKNPLGRMGKAEEVADLVVFVASPRAGFVTGSNLLVDGAVSTGVQF